MNLPDLDVVVMAHPDRATHARHLAVQLTARIVWDQGHGEWDTGCRAWQAIRPTSQWGVVVQDDALPIPHALRHMGIALTHAPCGPVGFYVGTGRPHARYVEAAVHRARVNKASWLEADKMFWGVAIALPTSDIKAMIAWAETSTMPYDNRIGEFYRLQGTPIRYTWPSLVDHKDEQSLVPRARRKSVTRKAHEVGPAYDGPTGHVVRI